MAFFLLLTGTMKTYRKVVERERGSHVAKDRGSNVLSREAYGHLLIPVS